MAPDRTEISRNVISALRLRCDGQYTHRAWATCAERSDKSGCCYLRELLTSDGIQLRESHAIHGRYFTCCKTSLRWSGKTRNMYRFCCNKQNYSVLSATTFHKLQQSDLLQDMFESWVVKRTTSLFILFSSNFENQFERFCCASYRSFTFCNGWPSNAEVKRKS